ncbi:MAG: Rrf2 family transcriptional regulator [Melioribacteraceae bacterium]|nr:Rrf2 family transcriptional regulator [Melioribacteraceae bacterium]
MLKLPKSVEYSFLALRYIAINSNGNKISVKEISENEKIPYELLAKILQRLVKHNIVQSHQGVKGGYILSKTPDKLDLATIMGAVENDIQITDCLFESATKNDCERVDDCCLRDPFFSIQKKINDLFRETYITDLL